MSRVLGFLLAGVLFGSGLAISGMTNPAKVLGYLDLTGDWDPSLVMVMVGAVLAYAVGSRLVVRRSAPALGGRFPSAPSRKLGARLFVGAGCFGIGWGLVGFCPGPAITRLGGMHLEAAGFVGAMALGMVVAQRVFGADR